MLITYTRAPHTICTEHRILGRFKLERKNIYFMQTLFAYLKDWCYSKVGSDKRRICGFRQLTGGAILLLYPVAA